MSTEVVGLLENKNILKSGPVCWRAKHKRIDICMYQVVGIISITTVTHS